MTTKKQRREAAKMLGHRGGMARKRKLLPARREEIARKAAYARWAKP